MNLYKGCGERWIFKENNNKIKSEKSKYNRNTPVISKRLGRGNIFLFCFGNCPAVR